jgi:hypothetical protein
MGLMALHLLLLSFNKVKPSLQGSVHIYSDCLGALNKVEHLPPQRRNAFRPNADTQMF